MIVMEIVDTGGAAKRAAKRAAMADSSMGLLSRAEHRAMDLTVELVKLVTAEIVADGPTRVGDLSEFVANIHGIQNMILAQAAARAYPDRYRLLGGTAGT